MTERIDMSTPSKSIEACIGDDSQYGETYWRDPRDCPDDVRELILIARGAVTAATYEYSMPIEDCDVTVCVWDHLYGKGAASPIVEQFWAEGSGRDRAWYVHPQPESYRIDIARDLGSYHVAGTVRHELAHICDWHENGYTTEQTGRHQWWLDELDAS